ncbi:MAG: type I restriction enzyme HsdR N-terminal domain-containing protein [Flavobacteriales bacterium]|jgi:predicted type IV restriction endonuclease|nr:type I restriction enzyme HsdR N-terminal domain-containing protein [Flavobacteriales bacterium]MBK6548848.1 type I restriction enzyme HsdR N-terminal domain-containing protein [Flavobacteriales bacterium]MBK6884554.1 type I restriction enzyme HsdR N-terminal domain-containing protein [Flavobacteriales bacterium]MBK7100955.1 type I restriction enzyme HsdR N-terminal domain-containing protein [Flavobacteriales bacterium]MBK7111640.1 type I restriction enzyme HsdR N-terminal domain-containing 
MEKQVLDLPDHGVKTKQGDHGRLVFDPFRRKWLDLTPEEWVRQHVLNYLVHDLQCPMAMVGVEVPLVLNGLSKRADIVVYGNGGQPVLIVECKSPSIKVDQRTFEQAARYNKTLQVRYLMVTNGLKHYCCAVDHERGSVDFLPRLPTYSTLTQASTP